MPQLLLGKVCSADAIQGLTSSGGAELPEEWDALLAYNPVLVTSEAPTCSASLRWR